MKNENEKNVQKGAKKDKEKDHLPGSSQHSTQTAKAEFVGRRLRIQFDIGYSGSPGKVMDPDSDTLPDMNLTVRQLLEDHTRGKDNRVTAKEPLYFETEIPTIRDITDVQKFKEQLEDRLSEVNNFIKNEKDQKDQKAAEKAAAEKKQNDVDTSKKAEEAE